MRRIWLSVSIAMLALAACSKKTELAADAVAPTEASAASTVADGINRGKPVDGDVALTAPGSVVAGGEVRVAFTGPANAKDYVDLVPRGYAQTSGEITYAYVETSDKRTAALRAPTKAGEYDIRYVLDLGAERKVKATSALSVSEAVAQLTAPATAGGGEEITVEWSGPDGAGDYIDLVKSGATATSGEINYAYTRNGNPAKVRAPGGSGVYDLRYVMEGADGRKVIATSTLTVTQPEASLKGPETAMPGQTFRVTWTGPNREGDYIDLVKRDYLATSGELAYFYVGPKVRNELKAPEEPGEYDIRYVLEAPGGRVVLAKLPLTVK